MAEAAARKTNVYPLAVAVKGRLPRARAGGWSPSCSARAPHPSSPNDAMLPPVPDDAPRRVAVLVLSSDPLAAALLGAAIELAGFAPYFPRSNESARAALLRARPRLVVVDCDHEEGCSDAFIGPALMTGSRVLLFRSRRTIHDTSELSTRLGLSVAEMPMDHGPLSRLLHRMLD